MYQRIARRHSLAGVTVREGARIEDTVQIEPEAVIEFGVSLRGCTTVGAATVIEVGCVIENSNIGGGALIKPYSVIGQSSVGEGAQIGPFAHIRPGSVLEQDVRIGNFVETKKTVMRRGSKANHLSYLGDGDIGERANIGAGTIFCNYDGYKKHKTIIGSNAFIGSDSQLVAPVVVGSGAYVASGTTVTKDVPGDALAISRVKQENKPGYAIRLRARTTNASEKK
jgi:bifunctional UDP-N-acetylglucosamine pyrophosphorylase/glucosamine-1-phosphate N-acetyltransferase